MMLSSMVTRPKSMATVVVVLWLPEPASSTPTDSEVIGASVVSGLISERAPTVVVLPTPNPPEMRIFTGIGGRRVFDPGGPAGPALGMVSEGSDTVDQPFDEKDVVGQGQRGRGTQQHPGGDQVPGEDLDDADRKTDPGRDLGDGDRLVTGGDDHGHFAGPGGLPGDRALIPDQHGLDADARGATAGPAPGEQVGPVVVAGLLVLVIVVGLARRGRRDGRRGEGSTQERTPEALLFLMARLVLVEPVVTVHSARFALS